MNQVGGCNSERRVQALERHMEALRLRILGEPYDAIAEQLGFASRSGAHRAVMSALTKTLREPAEELRTLELERLDTLMRPLMERAKEGSQIAVDRILRIMERRAKLLGLDAPERREVTGADGKPIGFEDMSADADSRNRALSALAAAIAGALPSGDSDGSGAVGTGE